MAKQFQKESQTEFLLSKMQPIWLQNYTQKWIYKIGIGLIGMLSLLLILGLLLELFFEIHSLLILRFRYFLNLVTFLWLVGGLICTIGLSQGNLPEIKTVETIQWSWGKISTVMKIIRDNYKYLFIRRTRVIRRTRDSYKHLGWWLYLFLSFSHSIGEKITKIDIIDFSINFLPTMLSVGLILLLIILLVSGINISDIKENVVPNQGIWNSGINAVIIALIIGLSCGMTVGLIFNTYKGLISGLSSGLIVGLWFGRCCAQHFILRIILSCSKLIPWNYARFLDYCTERLFLQRVGGRYRFIHRLLQEHFAAMPFEK